MRDVTGSRPQRGGSEGGQAWLRDMMAQEGGSISFERFMHEALYHPRFGYYSRRVKTVGPGGDFSTSATLHGALGQAVASWVGQRRNELAWRHEWHLVELGGGSGQMADEILRSLGWWARRRLRYHIVERSDSLRDEQQKLLSRWRTVRWHQKIEEALAAAGGHALIVSNEFVDAFPCVRLQWEGASMGWSEVQVAWQQETRTFAEKLVPWDQGSQMGDDSCYTSLLATHAELLPIKQRIEWHRSYLQWLQGWTRNWRGGCLLTIDYGDVWPRLYHRRISGTVRAYYQHKRCTGSEIYERVGRQDLTADVNFTALQTWGAALGMANTALSSQREFLRRWLPTGSLRRYEKEPAFAFLLDEAGAGSAFKVLEQRCVSERSV